MDNYYIKIAIVGRKNVGKSTLFNRLLGKRKSVVSEVEHTTRDRIYGTTTWNGYFYEIIDTGGIEYKLNKNEFLKNIMLQVNIAIEESDVILFVVDNQTGIQDLDFLIFNQIVKSNKKIVLIVNKADSIEKINYEIQTFPIHSKIYVSAIHGKNIYRIFDECEIYSNSLKKSENNNDQKNNIFDFSLSFVGLTNSGKSSLFNLLIKENRNIVSSTRNTTRDSINSWIAFDDNKIEIIDTPGFRIERKIIDKLLYYSYIRTYQSINFSDIVFFLIDISEELNKQVKKIFFYLTINYKPAIILLNKTDLVSHTKIKLFIQKMHEDLPLSQNYLIIPISVKNKKNTNNLLPKIIEIYKRTSLIIPTSKINDFLIEFQNLNTQFSKGKKTLKIYYGTMKRHKHIPTFEFFINSKSLLTKNFIVFFRKNLISSFEMKYVPIRINFKER